MIEKNKRQSQFALFSVIGTLLLISLVFVIFNRRQIKRRLTLQKEVAERIASPEGNKDYGILSVLLQAYYDIEYVFTVLPGAFNPPPKVDSGIIRLRRNQREKLPCNEKLFKQIVKVGFGQRRKMLRNPLKSLNVTLEHPFMQKRAEQLSVEDFFLLTNLVEEERTAKQSN